MIARVPGHLYSVDFKNTEFKRIIIVNKNIKKLIPLKAVKTFEVITIPFYCTH